MLEAEAPVIAAAAALASITFLSDTSTFAAPLIDGIIGGISLTLVGVFFGVAATQYNTGMDSVVSNSSNACMSLTTNNTKTPHIH